MALDLSRPDQRTLAVPASIFVPVDLNDAHEQLNGFGGLVSASNWAVAAIVHAHAEPGTAGRPARESVKSDRLTFPQFAALGIKGLTSHNTVARYWRAWQDAIDAGDAQPVERGEVATLPERDFKLPSAGQQPDGDEWYTPAWLFDALGLTFDLDVCGPADRTHVTVPCLGYYTEEDDGLVQPWDGLVWCNPPYSDPERWATRMMAHGNGLLLTHIPMNAGWAADVWRTCDGLRLFQAMEFVRPDGTPQRPGYWLQLAAFGDLSRKALGNLIIPDDVAENPRRVPSPMLVVA